MPYEKDIYGNVIGTGGDDTSLQNEKMAGYPGYNLFDKQREKAVLTPEQIQQRSGVNVGVPKVPKGAVSVVPSGVPVGNPQIVRQPATVSGGNANLEGNKAPRYAPITSTEQLAAAMGYTSPQEEERLRKASVTNQRIMAIGDALRHIGNIANTVRYAPSQQFNSPVTDEMARYERGKALRDAANSRYLVYQQQKERQDALQRRWENELEYKRQKADEDRKATEKYRDRVLKGKEAAQKYNEAKGNKELEERVRHNKAQEATANRRVDISASRASNSGSRKGRSVSGGTRAGYSGGKYWAYDEDGNIHYYPNKTMWEQGVNQFSSGLTNTETYNNGKEQKGKARSAASKGGELARRAAAKKKAATKPKAPSKGKATAKGKVSNKSGFFN